MYRSKMYRLDWYKKKYKIQLLVDKDTLGQTDSLSIGDGLPYEAFLIKKPEMCKEKEYTKFGLCLFKLRMCITENTMTVKDIEAQNLTARSEPNKEIFINMLVCALKEDLARRYDTKIIIIRSEEAFIQEALLAYNFKIRTSKNFKNAPTFSGLYHPAKTYLSNSRGT